MSPSSHSESIKVRRFRTARLLFRVALAATVIVALLLLLAQEILPWALQRAITELGGEVAGMRIEVGRVDVSLMRQEVSIEDISLASSTGGGLRSLHCRCALANVRLADLARGRVALAEVSVAQPVLEISGASRRSVTSSEVSAVVEEIRILGLPASPRMDTRLSRVDLAHPRIEILRPLRTPDLTTAGASAGPQPIPIASREVEIGLDWLSLFSAGLRRSLVRATTAPLRLIGALTASGALPEVPATWLGFVPGRASLSEEGRHRVRALAKLLPERPELAIRLHATATDADLATPERRAHSDLDDDQWIAELEARRTLAIASLLEDEYAVMPERVRVEAGELASFHPEPGVAIALEVRSLPGTPEIPDFPRPELGQSTPAVAAPPE